MKSVRLGIAGLGVMGRHHAATILAGKIPSITLTAVADSYADVDQYGPEVRGFRDVQEMLTSGAIDAVLIATPHYSHTELGIAALEAGLHVLVEKPISVHKRDAERLLAAHKDPGQIFAAMFNVRTNPVFIRLRELIQSGELGEIHRINWVITTWFRTAVYYRSGGWRATWEGEGGGVLLNQCPHQLDLLQWLFGMPVRLRAHCRFGHRHDIEVEDEVTAFLEYANGASGVFVTSTGEHPGVNRLEIAAERGIVTVENDQIRWKRNEVPTTEIINGATAVWQTFPVWNVEVPAKGEYTQHRGIMENFAAAILDNAPLIAPASEGIHSVELANAMLMSEFTGQTIELPLEGAAYEAQLQQRIEESRQRRNK